MLPAGSPTKKALGAGAGEEEVHAEIEDAAGDKKGH
jgi:hypothetical protein